MAGLGGGWANPAANVHRGSACRRKLASIDAPVSGPFRHPSIRCRKLQRTAKASFVIVVRSLAFLSQDSMC